MSRRFLRREFVAGIAQIPLLALTAGFAPLGRAAESCSDPDELTSSEYELRKSLDYTEAAENLQQTCSGCSYFSLDAAGPCGTCQILKGPANAKGHCASWTAKA